MLIAIKLLSFDVVGDTQDDANLRVMKKISRLEALRTGGINFSFDVAHSADAPRILHVTVYAVYNNKEIEERHCNICQESHRTFYNNRQFNCYNCEYKAYLQRVKEKESTVKSIAKGLLKSE